MSTMGQKRTSKREISMSAFLLRADPTVCVTPAYTCDQNTQIANLIARCLIHKEVSMRQIVIGITVALALAGMLASDAEAAAQCCRLSGRWFYGTMCRGTAAPRCCKQFGRWQCPCPH